MERGNSFNTRNYKGFFQSLRTIRRYDGLKGLYRGFLLSNAINIPFSISFLLSYELAKDISFKTNDNSSLFHKYFVVSLCGFMAQSVVYPLDTIRYFYISLLIFI